MKVSGLAVLTLAATLSATPAVLNADQKQADQKPAMKMDVPADLAKEAKISMDKAKEIALKKVPGGTIESAELEREKGKLVYSFDIKTSKPGVTEVLVNAMTGKVISVKHETPAAESAEKKKEAKEKATKH